MHAYVKLFSYATSTEFRYYLLLLFTKAHDWKNPRKKNRVLRRFLTIVLQDTRGEYGETDRQPNGISSKGPDARAGCRATVQKW